MREVEKAYVAGFLDGDGSIIASIEPHRELRLKYRVRVVVKFSQCKENKSLLDELKRILEYGYLSYSGNSAEYVIKSRENVRDLLTQIKPYVRAKKLQVDVALAILNGVRPRTKADLKKIASLADQIAGANLRSRSRRKVTSAKLPSH